jgi:hypothetical protein
MASRCLGLSARQDSARRAGVRQRCRRLQIRAGQNQILRCGATLRSSGRGQAAMSMLVRGLLGNSCYLARQRDRWTRRRLHVERAQTEFSDMQRPEDDLRLPAKFDVHPQAWPGLNVGAGVSGGHGADGSRAAQKGGAVDVILRLTSSETRSIAAALPSWSSMSAVTGTTGISRSRMSSMTSNASNSLIASNMAATSASTSPRSRCRSASWLVAPAKI